MVPNPDFSHYNKFLASLGIVLITAAVVLPWLFLQSTTSLSMPQAEIDALTPVAAQALRDRQVALSHAQGWLWWIPLLMAGAGAWLSYRGLKGWKSRQATDDDFADKQKEQELGAVTPATKEETESDLNQEASAEVVACTPPEQQESPRPSGGKAAAPLDRRSSIEQRRARIRQGEESVRTKLRDAYGESFNVLQKVRVGEAPGGAAAPVLDFVLQPPAESSWGQLGLDIRFMSSRTIGVRLWESIIRIAVATDGLRPGQVFTGRAGRPSKSRVNGILFIIVEEEASGGSEGMRLSSKATQRVLTSANSVLRTPVGVCLVRSGDLESVTPEELRAGIARAWSSPDSLALIEP